MQSDLINDSLIEDAAKDLIQTLVELDLPQPLAIYALCKAIVLLASEEDLDAACRIIDQMAEKEI